MQNSTDDNLIPLSTASADGTATGDPDRRLCGARCSSWVRGDVVQVGKYNIHIAEGQDVHIGDTNRQGPDAAAIQEALRQVLREQSKTPSAEHRGPLAEHLIAFDDLIAERTADFVGRAFLDARLASLHGAARSRLLRACGRAGDRQDRLGRACRARTRGAASLQRQRDGHRPARSGLENLCAQIIARFQLDQPFLPVNAGRDGSLLDKLLRQAAERLDGGKLVIVIDALDEAQMSADVRGANALYLPSSLPPGVYFVLTRRPQPMSLETVPGTPLETFTLGADLPDNQADVRAYLRQQAVRREIAVRLADRHIPTARFVEELAERSAGNFMYLAYLLPDIAAGLVRSTQPDWLAARITRLL